MLYTKHISDITWEDVELFCNTGTKEGAYLDYKKEFPTNLEKTISAMANTFGGVIIIGVDEKDDNSPIVPISGFQFQRGISEKVTNIILTNITPPVFPEVQVCMNGTGEKAVVVIRIPQSHETPHAITNNTLVYLRTGDRNKPEKLATIEEISWLNKNRNKSIELRGYLLEQSERRFKVFSTRSLIALLEMGSIPDQIDSGYLQLSACPSFPQNIFKFQTPLSEFHKKIWVKDYYGSSDIFPPFNNLYGHSDPIIVQDGFILCNHSPIDRRMFYTEINKYGIYYYKQLIKRDLITIKGLNKQILLASEIICRIDEFIESIYKYYAEIQYWGYMELNISLLHINELGLSLDWLNTMYKRIDYCPDPKILYTDTIMVSDIPGKHHDLVINIAKLIASGFSLILDVSEIESFFQKYKGH